MSLNDTSMHPTGAQAVYPGVANPSTSNANVIEDIPSKDSVAAASDDTTDAAKGPSRDTIEAKPGLIETTELAPLGEEKVVADPGLLTQATILGKKAYEAVTGSSETK